MVGVRLPKDTLRQVEQYAEDREISKSDALRRMIEKGVDLEEAGLTVAASHPSKEEDDEEKEVVADGGQVVRPMLQFMGAFYAMIGLTTFGIMAFSTFVYPIDFILGMGMDLIGMTLTALLLVGVLMIILYTDYPEKVDQLLYSGVQKISLAIPPIFGGSKS